MKVEPCQYFVVRHLVWAQDAIQSSFRVPVPHAVREILHCSSKRKRQLHELCNNHKKPEEKKKWRKCQAPGENLKDELLADTRQLARRIATDLIPRPKAYYQFYLLYWCTVRSLPALYDR